MSKPGEATQAEEPVHARTVHAAQAARGREAKEGRKKRKPVSASLRWSVYARDGFRCRYCGRQAGQDGVDLTLDHVVSVAEGGDDSLDNLVTACGACNGGKGARSLENAPAPREVVERLEEQAASLREQADGMRAVLQAQREVYQLAVDMKGDAYGMDPPIMRRGEAQAVAKLCAEFGADKVLEWYLSAAARDVPEAEALLYVRGCARTTRNGDAW